MGNCGKEETEFARELKELRRKNAQLEKICGILFEGSSDGIVFCGMDGRVQKANQAYLDMLGYTLKEIRKLNYQQLTPQRWWKMEDDLRENQVMKRGFCEVYEKEYIHKDGTIFPIRTQAWLIRDEHGNPSQLLGIVRDISREQGKAK